MSTTNNQLVLSDHDARKVLVTLVFAEQLAYRAENVPGLKRAADRLRRNIPAALAAVEGGQR